MPNPIISPRQGFFKVFIMENLKVSFGTIDVMSVPSMFGLLGKVCVK